MYEWAGRKYWDVAAPIRPAPVRRENAAARVSQSRQAVDADRVRVPA